MVKKKAAKSVKGPVKKAVKATKKAAPAKKAAPVKKAAAKAAPAPVRMPKNLSYKEPITKAEMFNTIAEATQLSRKQVVAVFDCLAEVIHGHLKAKAAGMCTIGGLLKVEVKRKAATKARKGVNPFTGEEIMIKAKPARNVVKVKALKKLKAMVD